MNKAILGISVIASAAAVGAAMLQLAPALAMAPVMQSYVPIGLGASGSTSTAWFHQPSSGTVVACQSGGAGGAPAGIQCVSAKLP